MKRRGFIKAILGSIALGTFELVLYEGAADALADLAPGEHVGFYALGPVYVEMAATNGTIIGPGGAALTVEYSKPKAAVAELGLKSMVQTVTESDGAKKTRLLYTDYRVLKKDPTCMWFGSPDEARKHADRRLDIVDSAQDYQRKNGLWIRGDFT